MSTSQALPELQTEGARFGIGKPPVRYDAQGDITDGQRVDQAMRGFLADFGALAATYMESCVHCGTCAEACPFYVTTEDPKYTPIWKIEPFKQAYKREVGPLAALYRLFGLKPKVTAARLKEWQELIYDSCTMCGRCTLACPMGIDIAYLVDLARHGMFKAGLVPHELWAVSERAHREGSPLGATPKVLRERVEWMGDEHDVTMHMNEAKADVLVTMSSIEIQKYPASMAATAKILNQVGMSWTFHEAGYEATNFGMLSGNLDWQREASRKLIDTAIMVGAKILLLPECGHAYTALRWQGANMFGHALPFRVLHVTEFIAEMIAGGKLRLRGDLAKTATFHDPCQLVRRGGVIEAPRTALAALGVELRELADNRATSWCCGGGGGVVANHRADPIRYQATELKMRQVDATGAEMFITSCSNCRQTFDDGQAHFHWERTVHSLLDLVAENLAP